MAVKNKNAILMAAAGLIALFLIFKRNTDGCSRTHCPVPGICLAVLGKYGSGTHRQNKKNRNEYNESDCV